MGPRDGFVERPITRNGQPYVQRTFVAGGRTYVSVYSTHYYHNVVIYHYVPSYYFAPGFYEWASYPWGSFVVYNWGWFGMPWFTYYGSYFALYPAYSSASLWLTDYLLAEDLQLEYQDHAAVVDSNADGAAAQYEQGEGTAYLSSELKLAIAQEVQRQLATDQAFAVSPEQAAVPNDRAIPPALDPKLRVFIVSSILNESTADGQECSLTSGDVLTRVTDTPDANQNVLVRVLSSKETSCPAGSQVTVSVQDLQEMHNRFHEQIEAGLGKLAENQGREGLPVGPAAEPRDVPEGQPAEPAGDALATLQQQQWAADQVETRVRQLASSGPSAQGSR